MRQKTSCQAIYKYETVYALPAIYREEGDCWTNRMVLSRNPLPKTSRRPKHPRRRTAAR
jgi:hypothetical protein